MFSKKPELEKKTYKINKYAMAENLAYTTLIQSLGTSNPIHTSNRHSLYDDNVLFEYEIPNPTVSTTNTSSTSSSFFSSKPTTNTSSTTLPSTAAVRRVLVLNDGILICKASKDGLQIIHELLWDTLIITDLLPYTKNFTTGPYVSILQPLLQNKNYQQQLLCSILLTNTSDPQHPIILYTSSYQDKLQWLSMLQTTLPIVISPEKQINKHWLHTIYKGTIYSACYYKDIEMVKALLQYSPNSLQSETTSFDQFTQSSSSSSTNTNTPIININENDYEGYTPLHLATIAGSQPIVSLLLESGSLIDSIDNEDFNTALHIACFYGYIDISNLFIVNGSNLNTHNLLEQTPLTIILIKLLDLTNQYDKAIEYNDKQTINQINISEKEYINLIELMLNYNCDINQSDTEGLYPFHRLCLTRADTLVRSFVRHGANPANVALLNRPSIIQSINLPLGINNHGISSASSSSSIGTTIADQLTALHVACGITFEGDIRSLIHLDSYSSSLANLSLPKIRSTMIVALLKAGCQPNARTSQGETSLHIILRLLKEIIDLPASNNAEDVNELNKSLNPLRAELQAIASLLCTYGARLDIPDNYSITCLDLAIPLNIHTKLEASYNLFIDRIASSASSLSSATAASNPIIASQRFDKLYQKNQGTIPLPTWKADNSSNQCLLCSSAFTMTKRRHHCRWCGLLVCDNCSKKRFPIPRRTDDSDDDDYIANTSQSKPKENKTLFGGLLSALSITGDKNNESNDIDRVCDGCFNNLCTLAEISVEEEQKWETEKAQALLKSRNMVNKDKEDKIKMDKIKNAIKDAKLSPDEERSALFARGSGGTASTSSSSSSSKTTAAQNQTSALQNTLNDNKSKLMERGERLSRLDEKMRDMNAAAADFASMADQLKKKNKGGWFF